MSVKFASQHLEVKATLPVGSMETLNPDYPELIERIIFFTDQSDKSNTRLVCRAWNDLTLSACKYPIKQDLKQTVSLLSENLDQNKHHRSLAKLVKIQDMFQSLITFLVTPAQTRRLFLISTGCILGVLKNLSAARISPLQQMIGHQLPISMNRIFQFTAMTLEASILTGDFDVFYILFHSCRHLSKEALGRAAIAAAEKGHTRMLRTLLSNGRISTVDRGTATYKATTNTHPDCVQWLLDNGSISEHHRGISVRAACMTKNEKLLRLLLENGPIPDSFLMEAIIYAGTMKNIDLARFILTRGTISEKPLGYGVKFAAKNNDSELLPLLLAHGPIAEEDRGAAVCAAAEHDNFELVECLLTNGPISEEDRGEGVRLAAIHNNPTLMRLLLNNGPISEKAREKVVRVATIGNPDLLRLLQAYPISKK